MYNRGIFRENAILFSLTLFKQLFKTVAAPSHPRMHQPPADWRGSKFNHRSWRSHSLITYTTVIHCSSSGQTRHHDLIASLYRTFQSLVCHNSTGLLSPPWCRFRDQQPARWVDFRRQHALSTAVQSCRRIPTNQHCRVQRTVVSDSIDKQPTVLCVARLSLTRNDLTATAKYPDHVFDLRAGADYEQ